MSEKVKDIKKALECCSTLMDNNATSEEQDNSCNECPYRQNDRCSWNLDKDALMLINELESEKERLTKELDSEWKYRRKAEEDLHKEQRNYKIGLTQSQKRNKELKDRIAELEKDNELLRNAKVVYETVDYCYEDLKKAEKRIADLEKERTQQCIDCIEWRGANEKIKQFAERLKEKAMNLALGNVKFNNFLFATDIDETLEEFLK